VADPTHRWISELWVTVQPAHSDDTSVVIGDEEGFPWLVEPIETSKPFTQEAGKNLEPAGICFRHQGAAPGSAPTKVLLLQALSACSYHSNHSCDVS
jgi:hypothetical protein